MGPEIPMRKLRILLASLLFAATVSFSPKAPAQIPRSDWHAKLAQQLPLLGHRNWILIVDSAYPLQVSPGVEVIETGADQLAVTRGVLGEIGRPIHVRP